MLGIALSEMVLADDEQATADQLEQLKSEIKKIQQRMQAQEDQRDALQVSLRETELDINRLDKQLARVAKSIDAETSKLERLESERIQLEDEVTAEKEALNSDLRNLWSLQQGGGLRILFGDQEPQRVARNLAYYELLLDSRGEQIARLRGLAEKLAANASAIRVTRDALDSDRRQLASQRDRSQALRKKREQTVAEIERQIGRDGDRMAKLEGDRKRLTNLLSQLKSAVPVMKAPGDYPPFVKSRSAIKRPVDGKPRNRFGEQRNAGNMRWRGWIIPARGGADVKAIYFGRVVYADWLRGHGLLLIIDHGDGWLSLYGQNRTLQKQVGDWVSPDDTIATVGASGGAIFPALYFEIRKDGDPVDPGKWVPG
ncbi:peptidase M23B [Luminiphilus syltensis NOR5-1B]|uniref:Peptidase M23B n=1 Tax=Luminiphilus syltensis NOR5-1B TaxID=565045 RepID=B8KUN8_9GAMM|nr:peptidase M23B [Luminiphilus syltensis NOR5-1B]